MSNLNNKNFHILVLDDEVDLAEIIAEELRDMGFKATTINKLKDANEVLKITRFNAIISDLKLSDGNGTDLLKVLKNFEPKIPIIFITGFISDSEYKTLSSVEMVLNKPINFKVLKNLLEKIHADSVRNANPYLNPAEKFPNDQTKTFEVKTFVIRNGKTPERSLVTLFSADDTEVFVEINEALLSENDKVQLEIETINSSNDMKCIIDCIVSASEGRSSDKELFKLKFDTNFLKENKKTVSNFYAILTQQQEYITDFLKEVKS